MLRRSMVRLEEHQDKSFVIPPTRFTLIAVPIFRCLSLGRWEKLIHTANMVQTTVFYRWFLWRDFFPAMSAMTWGGGKLRLF